MKKIKMALGERIRRLMELLEKKDEPIGIVDLRKESWWEEKYEIILPDLCKRALITPSKYQHNLTFDGLQYLTNLRQQDILIKQAEFQRKQINLLKKQTSIQEKTQEIQTKQNEILEEQNKIQKENKGIQMGQTEALIEQNEISKNIKTLQKWNVMVMVLLVLSTIIIAFYQYNLQDDLKGISLQQTQILESTSISNKAELFFNAIGTRGEILPSFELKRVRENKGKIEIFIANIGRIPSGRINLLEWKDDWLYPYGISDVEEGSRILDDTKSGETRRTLIPLTIADGKEIKKGIQKIHLKYDCSFCKPTTNIEEIEICLYENYEEDCK